MFKAPFSFDGRIRRIEYFLSGIIGGIVSSIAWALGVGTFVLGAASGSAGGSVFGLLIGLAAMIASIWFSLAQGVKRLHDLNKSGWLILLCLIWHTVFRICTIRIRTYRAICKQHVQCKNPTNNRYTAQQNQPTGFI